MYSQLVMIVYFFVSDNQKVLNERINSNDIYQKKNKKSFVRAADGV